VFQWERLIDCSEMFVLWWLVFPALMEITGSCCITFVGTSHPSILTAFDERYPSKISKEKKSLQKNVRMGKKMRKG